MISWMQHHTLYVNNMPAAALVGSPGLVLDPQECFNKALETVAALHPPPFRKRQRRGSALRSSCGTYGPRAHSAFRKWKRLSQSFTSNCSRKGGPKKGAETVLAQALHPQGDTNDRGLVYISAELVSDVKECKYGLGWDTPYRNCQHQEISSFTMSHTSMKHQQEQSAYQERLYQASTTTLETSRKAIAAQVQRRKTTMDYSNCCPTTSA
jgi:hypothetical protein